MNNRRERSERPLIRWKTNSRTAAPTMVVSQVDRLQLKEKAWKGLVEHSSVSVAAGPPGRGGLPAA